MAKIHNLERQHVEIINNIELIKNLIKNKDFEKHTVEAAKQINLLAGKLKVHLESEDKFLYPSLVNEENTEIKKIANQYMREMGNILEKFTEYKNKFNTKSKIENDIDIFIKLSNQIFDLIETRMKKEDKYLYPLIKK